MERAAPDPRSAWAAKYSLNAAAAAVSGFCCVVRQHIETTRNEVDELKLGDGFHTHQGSTAGCADDGGLCDRGIDNAAGAEMVNNPAGKLKGPAIGANIFAYNENGLVAGHLFPNAVTDSLDHCDGLCLLLWCG